MYIGSTGERGPAPPGLRDRRQRGRRGARRPLRHDHGHAARRRRRAGAGQRPRHPGRHPPGRAAPGGRGRADDAARRRQVRRRVLRGLRRSARRRCRGRQRAVHAHGGRDPPRRPGLDAVLRALGARAAARGRRDRRDRHDGGLLGRPRHLHRDDDLLARDAAPPAAGDGVPQQGPRHHPARRAARAHRRRGRRGALPLPRRSRGLRPPPQPHPVAGAPDRHRLLRRDDERHAHVGRGGDAVERLLLRVGLHLRQHHQHRGGRHPRGGLPHRADDDLQRLGAQQGPPQGEGLQPRGLRHPRGPDRDHQPEDRRPAVRGPDQDQARQLRGQDLRAEGDPRVAQGLVRPQPDRRQDDRRSRRRRPPAPAWPPGRRASSRGARACSSPPRCRASSPTASRPTRASPRSTSSRATAPAAAPRAAATRSSRRSCPSAARS